MMAAERGGILMLAEIAMRQALAHGRPKPAGPPPRKKAEEIQRHPLRVCSPPRCLYNRVRRGIMTAQAREYIDFWIENSVHAVEQFRTPGASQEVAELVRRLIEGAKAQGISEKDMRDEVGDLTEYVRDKLRAANKAEDDRTDRRRQ
jgi:hypothetical protein